MYPLNTALDAPEVRAKRVFPGGTTRGTLVRKSKPIFAAEGHGAYITGLDGKRYLDCSNNFTSLIHGHAHKPTVEAIATQVAKGTAFSLPGLSEIALAEDVQRRSSTFEKIVFANSGTEAVMFALKAARAFTGRSLVAKCEGAYHGLSDFAEVSNDSGPSNWGEGSPQSTRGYVGAPDEVAQLVLALPFNDAYRSLEILEHNKHRLAAVLLDPMPSRAGLVPATKEYLEAIRNFCTTNSVVLIMDEVIVFRLAWGGAGDYFGVRPDISTLAKIIGGGLPVGAIAGREDIMNGFSYAEGKANVSIGGTFTANPMSMVAGAATLASWTPEAIDRLNSLGAQVRDEVSDFLKREQLSACITGAGSLFRIHVETRNPRDYRSSYMDAERVRRVHAIADQLEAKGIHLLQSGLGCLSTAMTAQDVALLTSELRSALKANCRKI